MDVQHVLLSPKGRIGPRDFSRWLILLTGAMMIIQIAAALVSRPSCRVIGDHGESQLP